MRAAIISLGSKSSVMTADAMKQYFSKVDLLNIKKIEISVGVGGAGILYEGKPMDKYDCVYVKGSFRSAAIQRAISTNLAGKCYMPYTAKSFSIVHNKLFTHLELETFNIPMPKTYISASSTGAKEILKNIKYPIIMKIPQGTQGKGVMFADSFAAASSILDTLDSIKQPFIIQEYVETGGTDLRAFVIGDKVVACMKRKSGGEDKRANLHAGGSAQVVEITPEIEKISIKTAKSLNAQICGVDILENVKGPVVIEANLSPGLQGITEATGIDIADKIASYLAKKTAMFLEEKEKDKNLDKLLNEEGIKQVAPKSQENVLDTGDLQNIITTLDFRGERLLLPKLISKVSKFKEETDYLIEFKKDNINIKKM